LIARTHQAGLKVIIDIVPNHMKVKTIPLEWKILVRMTM
jgi:pullulanase/glycogen debranching enzyme